MNVLLRAALVLLLALGVTAPASAGRPFNFDQVYGRLPKDVVPIRYTVSLAPDAATLGVQGDETVILKFRSASQRIQFNSFHQTLGKVTLDGHPVASVHSDDEAQLTTVELTQPAKPGVHELRFSFNGRIDDSPQGLFRQEYVDPAGHKGVLLTTLMESTYARHMFPCWDEPAFRARFQLSVTAPRLWTAVSNMPVQSRSVRGELATTQFAPTPPMSSYLVELTVGDIAAVSARAADVDFGIWSVRGQEAGGQQALANAQQILADYNDYFGIRYPLPKLDSLAIPGGFSGAMENWGAITYNEGLLLLTGSSTMTDRQAIYSVQAHEMAHLWFGDLVTMGWWDDIWLNESFASWMAARETDRRNPEWHWWLDQDDDKERAMRADSIAGVHAIEQHITDEKLIDNSFDFQITYSKGQAILRMLEEWLGPDRFRDGIRRYMKARAYSNANSADLWAALGAAGRSDVAAVASGWTQQPGFPLLEARAHCDAQGARTVTVEQRRFFLDGSHGEPAHWKVPLVIRSGSATATRAQLIDDQTGAFPAGRCGEALSLNANAIGYFRVHYDSPTLDANRAAFRILPAGDRLALLDDQWALATSGQAPLADHLALAAQLKPEDEPHAWQRVALALELIEQAQRSFPGHESLLTYARQMLTPVLLHLGWDSPPGESADRRALRQQLITDLGTWGDPHVIDEAQRRFRAFVSDHATIPADEQPAILAVTASHADVATFEALLKLATGSRDIAEINRYYGALANVQDPALARRVIELALSKQLPIQANDLPLQLVLTLANYHQRLAWEAYTGHTDQLLAYNPSFSSLTITQATPAIFWQGIPIAEVGTFMRAHVPASMTPEIERGLQVGKVRLLRRDILVRESDALQHR